MPSRSRIFIKLAVLVAIAGLLVILFVPKITSHPKTTIPNHSFSVPVIPTEMFVLHNSQRNLLETHVPFHLYHGVMIEIIAAINGKRMNCIVDTGCPDLLWKTCRHLTQNRTGFKLSIGDAGNHSANVEEAILDQVQIGGLELDHVPSYAVAEDRTNDQRDFPILGNSVFRNTVLTINYVKQELIIRPSKPASASVGAANYSHALNFQWVNPDARGKFGVPCIRGTVVSLPVNIAVDTGWGQSSLALTRNFYDRLLPQLHARHVEKRQETIGTALGTTNATVTGPISLYIGSMTIRSPAVVVDSLNQGAQATLGCQFLECFQTTIDYPRQKIWFDPVQARPIKTLSH